MPCTEANHLRARRAALLLAGLAAVTLAVAVAVLGCAGPSPFRPAPMPVTGHSSSPALQLAPAARPASVSEAPAPTTALPAPAVGAAPAAPAAWGPRYMQLGAPLAPRNAAELRMQLARRLVAAHPDTSYTSRAPDRLLAIPVLEIELNADGSVRNIAVLRKPSTGNEATALAIAAVRRAAPYGDVSKLPRPWKVVETFLFDDDLRFKPRTLDTN